MGYRPDGGARRGDRRARQVPARLSLLIEGPGRSCHRGCKGRRQSRTGIPAMSGLLITAVVPGGQGDGAAAALSTAAAGTGGGAVIATAGIGAGGGAASATVSTGMAGGGAGVATARAGIGRGAGADAGVP